MNDALQTLNDLVQRGLIELAVIVGGSLAIDSRRG